MPATLLLALTFSAQAETLTLERIFDSPELSGPTLRQARLSPAGDRVTYLRGRDEDRNLMDLWEYHLEDNANRRLVAADEVVEDEGELSAEEQARRERARIADLRGIVEYRWSEDGRFLLFPLAGDIYVLDMRADQPAVVQVTDSDDFDIDPQVAPDGRHVGFIRNQDLWIAEIETGRARPLTEDGGGVISNGVAEFIAQEEMGRSTGYWWSPDGDRIAFLRIDESPIEPSLRHEIDGGEIRVIQQRYPYAGTPNVTYRFGVVDIDDGATEWIDLGEETDIYIPRVNWLPDGNAVAFQRQSRDQKTLELVVVELNADGGPEDGAGRVLVRETSETWINLHDDLHFLSQMPGFIWSSERSGYRHLYLYDLEGEQVRQLTAGEWAVDELEGVDEELGLVYFSAAEISPTERHLYRQSLVTTSPDIISRVSRRSGWHDISMDRRARVYVNNYSSFDQPPQVSVHSADGERIAWLLENRITAGHPYLPFRNGHRPARFGTLVGPDGQDLHYRMIRPADFDEDRRYPVLVHVYGGPTHRLVTNSWGRRHLIDQYLARQGYIVFSLDNRGIVRQGKRFQDAAYKKLGRIEITDQMVGLDFLKGLDFVDAERIGIFGWSYGGYLALMALMQHPGTFAAGVAVAPVTDWALYDTHYTERYLGQPRDADGNPTETYREGNVLNYATELDDPLFLIHPMADDNVLFTHSTMLMQKLQDHAIAFELMTYPGEKHAIAGEGQRLHVYRVIDRFLRRNLKPDIDETDYPQMDTDEH